MSKDKNHKSPLENSELKKSVFQLPADYFDQFEGRLMANIQAQDGELATNEHLKKNVFEVPDGYFNELEGKITDGLRAEDGELASNEHLKKNVFHAPEGYFSSLNEKITAKLETESTTKVIPLYQRNWFKFAVAAMLVVGIFMFLPKGSDTDDSAISEDLMLEYLYEKQDIAYELMALSEDFEDIMDNILLDETSVFDFSADANLELEYHFEYFEQ